MSAILLVCKGCSRSYGSNSEFKDHKKTFHPKIRISKSIFGTPKQRRKSKTTKLPTGNQKMDTLQSDDSMGVSLDDLPQVNLDLLKEIFGSEESSEMDQILADSPGIPEIPVPIREERRGKPRQYCSKCDRPFFDLQKHCEMFHSKKKKMTSPIKSPLEEPATKLRRSNRPKRIVKFRETDEVIYIEDE